MDIWNQAAIADDAARAPSASETTRSGGAKTLYGKTSFQDRSCPENPPLVLTPRERFWLPRKALGLRDTHPKCRDGARGMKCTARGCRPRTREHSERYADQKKRDTASRRRAQGPYQELTATIPNFETEVTLPTTRRGTAACFNHLVSDASAMPKFSAICFNVTPGSRRPRPSRR
jgi:hypothetical protein